MELRHYLRMLGAGWWIIILTMLAALSVALVVAYNATPMYRTSARLIVRPNFMAIGSNNLIDSIGTLDKRSIVATYAEVINSNRLFNETGNALQLDSKALLDYTRTAVVLPEANILELTITGPNPDVDARLVNGISQRAIEYAKTLYQAYNLEFLDPALVPIEPFAPQPIRDASLATMLGLVLGAALAILRDQLRMPLEALRRRNIFDEPSSAFTRQYFQRRLDQELDHHPSTVSVSILELEGLDGLSETLPAPVFSSLLRRVTKILQTELRGRDCIGRWNAISFALLLPSTPGTAAVQTLTRVQQALSNPFVLDEAVGQETVKLEPLIGVGSSIENDDTLAILKRAELALEKAKHNGHAPVLLNS
jgi:diguanylate cyclase (GGDEF)-like protein